MTEREKMGELHVALDGAVDSLSTAHRLGAGELGAPGPYAERLDRLLAEAVALRNEVRDRLLGMMGRGGSG
jgi:hypothetical protein